MRPISSHHSPLFSPHLNSFFFIFLDHSHTFISPVLHLSCFFFIPLPLLCPVHILLNYLSCTSITLRQRLSHCTYKRTNRRPYSCIHVHIHVHIHTHTHTHTHSHANTHTQTHAHTYTHTHSITHTHTCTRTYTRTYTRTHTLRTQTHTHTHTHPTYTHTHTHTHTQACTLHTHYTFVQTLLRKGAVTIAIYKTTHTSHALLIYSH